MLHDALLDLPREPGTDLPDVGVAPDGLVERRETGQGPDKVPEDDRWRYEQVGQV